MDAQTIIARRIALELGDGMLVNLGIASLLLRHLLSIARGAGIEELHAEVLAENGAMLGVFGKFGATITKSGGSVHVSLRPASPPPKSAPPIASF